MTERFRLNNGMTIPKIGFGTYKAAADGTERVISEAIQAGYRYFDTASFYGTEEALGKAWTQSNLERGAFQIASKAWKSELGYREVRAAFEKSLERLRTDYLDLYLIHSIHICLYRIFYSNDIDIFLIQFIYCRI